MSHKRRIVLNTLVNGVAQTFSLLFGLILMPLLIRSFGMRDYGVYLIASSVGAYASLLDLGVGQALIKLTAEKSAEDDRSHIAKLASTGLAFYIAVGATIAVLLMGLALGAGAIFKVNADGARLLRNLLLVTAAASLVNWPLTTFTYVLQGFQRYSTTARTAISVLIANAAISVGVLLSHQGPLALLVGTSAAGILGSTWNVIEAKKLIGDSPVTPWHATRGVFRNIVNFSWAVFVIQLCTVVIYQQTDRLIIGIVLGAAAVTLYEAAGKFQGLVVQLTGFTNSAVLPAAARLESEGEMERVQTLYLRGTKYSLALLLPVVTTLMVFSHALIKNWLGPAFVGQVFAAQLFLSHQMLTPSTAIGDSITTGMGKLHKRVPYVVGILTVGNLVLSIWLVHRIGVLGVVVGTVVPHFIDFPFHMNFLLTELKVSLSTYLRRVALPVYPLLLVPVAVGFGLRLTPLVGNLAGVAMACVVTAGSYWIALAMFGFDAQERAELGALVSAIKARFGRDETA